jgi:class 3 adenylate cyclase
MAERPHVTDTFLFTDIEGSTRLLRELGDGYLKVLADHHQLIRSAIGSHGGRVEGTEGDAFFVVFENPANALAAALEAQLALSTHSWPTEALRVRMGLHTGDAALAATGYVGLAVNQAARIAAAAHGGQVLLSETTYRLAEHSAAEVSFRDLGLHRLKG